LEKVEHKHIVDIFGINSWTSPEDFIEQVAKMTGKLKKGGEADYHNVATTILYDWQRGHIPYFEMPPKADKAEAVDDMPDAPVVVE